MDLDDEELKATRRMNGSDKNVGSMKEDIKLVGNLIKEYRLYGDLDGIAINDMSAYINALEHLIKAYKEEKEENESADRVNKALIKQMERNNNIIEDLTNKISELQEEIKDERYFNKHNVEVYKEKTKNSIPVSLVKEKIEEYEEKAKRIAGTYQYADSGEDLENKKKQVIELRTKAEGLQDFLEGK